MRRYWVFTIAIVATITTYLGGCGDDKKDYYDAPTLVGDIYDYCYGSEIDCTEYALDLLLYLYTEHLPEPDGSDPWLRLQSIPGHDGYLDRIAFAYEDTLPAEFYDLMKNQHGWKARISNARVEYVDLPSDGGVGKGLSLYGDLEQVEFVYDPEDTLGIAIQWHELR